MRIKHTYRYSVPISVNAIESITHAASLCCRSLATDGLLSPFIRNESPVSTRKMLLDIALSALALVVACWILFEPILRAGRTFWGAARLIFDSNTVDLKARYGEWAVVTGSTDGIGKAYAKELAVRGMSLVLISRNFDRLENTRKEILATNPNVEVKVIVADFSKGKDIYEKISIQLQDLPVAILVNNVGKQYEYPMYLGEVPETELWDIINVNVGATTLMTRMLIGAMEKRGRGAIVNVSSGSELQPLPLMTVYAATKIYVKSFSEALRAEYSRSGITVQHLVPFFINTKMNAFSAKLQVSSVMVPDATTYARNAVATLGKLDSSTGYWAHGIQQFFTVIPPVWVRTKIGQLINQTFREDYFKGKTVS
ncbi:inactive hydroxysteroid dehydrogenase-like protein 1 isoform X1 [Neodiprion pinetum]|uniref:inactive hydroxysteroid dehydrogenase-like protein 1 isoform X1 n=1 Tax=Neodiprion pinetum TaxID=441929 RepID=UPI001EDF930C|nr:inactive hydroxysteroid dehydrogenase-like protein 1 isoform X1 [Neodiprion pinetum]